jgi:hypothetical protein
LYRLTPGLQLRRSFVFHSRLIPAGSSTSVLLLSRDWKKGKMGERTDRIKPLPQEELTKSIRDAICIERSGDHQTARRLLKELFARIPEDPCIPKAIAITFTTYTEMQQHLKKSAAQKSSQTSTKPGQANRKTTYNLQYTSHEQIIQRAARELYNPARDINWPLYLIIGVVAIFGVAVIIYLELLPLNYLIFITIIAYILLAGYGLYNITSVKERYELFLPDLDRVNRRCRSLENRFNVGNSHAFIEEIDKIQITNSSYIREVEATQYVRQALHYVKEALEECSAIDYESIMVPSIGLNYATIKGILPVPIFRHIWAITKYKGVFNILSRSERYLDEAEMQMRVIEYSKVKFANKMKRIICRYLDGEIKYREIYHHIEMQKNHIKNLPKSFFTQIQSTHHQLEKVAHLICDYDENSWTYFAYLDTICSNFDQQMVDIDADLKSISETISEMKEVATSTDRTLVELKTKLSQQESQIKAGLMADLEAQYTELRNDFANISNSLNDLGQRQYVITLSNKLSSKAETIGKSIEIRVKLFEETNQNVSSVEQRLFEIYQSISLNANCDFDKTKELVVNITKSLEDIRISLYQLNEDRLKRSHNQSEKCLIEVGNIATNLEASIRRLKKLRRTQTLQRTLTDITNIWRTSKLMKKETWDNLHEADISMDSLKSKSHYKESSLEKLEVHFDMVDTCIREESKKLIRELIKSKDSLQRTLQDTTKNASEWTCFKDNRSLKTANNQYTSITLSLSAAEKANIYNDRTRKHLSDAVAFINEAHDYIDKFNAEFNKIDELYKNVNYMALQLRKRLHNPINTQTSERIKSVLPNIDNYITSSKQKSTPSQASSTLIKAEHLLNEFYPRKGAMIVMDNSRIKINKSQGVNVNSTLTNVNQNIESTLTGVNQAIGSIRNADQAAKEELQQLVAKLNEALQKVPSAHEEEAAAVAECAKALVENAAKEKPNKTTVQISAEGLKKAASNIAAVMPVVWDVANEIVDRITKLQN